MGSEIAAIIDRITREHTTEPRTITGLLESGDRQAENILDLAEGLQVTHRDLILALAKRIGGQLGQDLVESQSRDSERNAP